MNNQLTLDEIIDYMLDLLNTSIELRLAIVDAEGEPAERFRKNAVWYFAQMTRYAMTADDTKAFIRNMHYIQTPQANQQKRQMAYVSLHALQERYEMVKESNNE